MNQVSAVSHDARHSLRLQIPKGKLLASLPPPEIWNWFTDSCSVYILNISQHGLGISSVRPVRGELLLRLKNSEGEQVAICGCICHRQETQNGYYYGLDCSDAQAELLQLLSLIQ